jgi:hypothetical protein
VRLRTCDVCRKSCENDPEHGRSKAAPIDVVGVWGFGGSIGLGDMCRDCFVAFDSAARKWFSERATP